ncbi:pentapeptide repeat-containing protein [Phenylobacterium aquaticum]|uniref:pentapeptide repeat-containing protein n=1 Tax=Phenylobacterium aquaticum TaxID=1763816 RepID=UPI001F5DDFE7|nr:pentapeptide repeat-containing protein [Phenylobacterium aquaticum]MCI3135662.1 pentapeptide repeat-containing protein [Phenylobacterium aquaticum]
MKPLLIASLVASLALPAAALAQNAGQIASARRGSSCPGCNLFQADFSGLELKGRNFTGARLRQADLSLAVMNRTSFARTDLRDINAYGGVFSSANFAGADLTHASFVGAYLQGANLAGARLDGTNFSGAELDHVRGLSQAQLNRACGDAATRIPPGLRIPAC